MPRAIVCNQRKRYVKWKEHTILFHGSIDVQMLMMHFLERSTGSFESSFRVCVNFSHFVVFHFIFHHLIYCDGPLRFSVFYTNIDFDFYAASIEYTCFNDTYYEIMQYILSIENETKPINQLKLNTAIYVFV